MKKHDILFEGRHLRVMQAGTWEYVQRPNISGIVVIVPVTDDNEAVLVEQYRPAVEANVIEWPAGLAGDVDPGEALMDAAQRELVEETGYSALTMVHVIDGPPSAGLSDEFVDFFTAHGLVKKNAGGGDESEEITVHNVPVNELAGWLREQRKRGVLIDPKVYTGLYLLEHPEAAHSI